MPDPEAGGHASQLGPSSSREALFLVVGDNYPSMEVASPLQPSSGFLDNDAWAVEAVATTERVDSGAVIQETPRVRKGAGRPCYQLSGLSSHQKTLLPWM